MQVSAANEYKQPIYLSMLKHTLGLQDDFRFESRNCDVVIWMVKLSARLLTLYAITNFVDNVCASKTYFSVYFCMMQGTTRNFVQSEEHYYHAVILLITVLIGKTLNTQCKWY